MRELNPFPKFWLELQRLQPIGITPAWSLDGRATSEFEIVDINPNEVIVKPKSGKSRKIPASEFEKVFSRWREYLSGRFARNELRNLTQNSTYIITILHLLEIEQSIGRLN